MLVFKSLATVQRVSPLKNQVISVKFVFFLDIPAAVTTFAEEFSTRAYLSFHAVLSAVSLFLFVIQFQMAQRCSPNEYFDRLLNSCISCQLRCPNTPPVICQHYCNTSKWSCLNDYSLVWSTRSVCVCLVAQLCLTLCDPMDCNPPGSSIHGDSPGKNTGVGCHAFLHGNLPNPGLPCCRQILYPLSHQGSPRILELTVYSKKKHYGKVVRFSESKRERK